MALLGKEKYALLKEIKISDQDRDKVATAIWSAAEASKKLTAENIQLKVIKYEEKRILFRILFSNIERDVVCFGPIFLKNENRILAFTIPPNMAIKETEGNVFNDLGYDRSVFKADVALGGPQGQVVYVQRFPVTFKNNQQLSRRVYFTSYFDWIGLMREYSLYPIMSKITDFTESGGWGLATNQVITRIWGDLRANDVVEIRCWVERVLNKTGATFDTSFEWNKVLTDGQTEKIAYGELRSTWIQITGHGVARIGELPTFLEKFVNEMKPKEEAKVSSLESVEKQYVKFDMGKITKDFKNKGLLFEQNFQTSLEDSNLVGNIYFSNYAKWLGRTRDLFFYNLVPGNYRGTGENGEFFTLNCDIFHLQEAMPFDNVLVKMYVSEIFERGFNLYFEYFLNNKSITKKLASATQKIQWVKRKNNVLFPEELPGAITNSLKTIC